MLSNSGWTCQSVDVYSHYSLNWSRDSVASIVTRQRAVRFGVRIPAVTKYLFLQNVQSGCGVHPASCSVVYEGLSTGGPGQGVRLHLVSRLRIRGAVSPVSLYVFMAWTGEVYLYLTINYE